MKNKQKIAVSSPSSLLAELKRCVIFKNWPEKALREIIPLVKKNSFAKGEIIVEENRPARYLFVLARGEVAISVKWRSGELVTEVVKKKGDILGWSALVPPQKYTASAKGLQEGQVLVIKGRDLERYLKKRPALGWLLGQRLAALISSRLRHTRSFLAQTLA